MDALIPDEQTRTQSKSDALAYDLVIVAYHSKECVKKLLSDFMRISNHPTSVIIVNNSSSDHITELLDEYPNLTIISNTDNYGFAKAANQGWQQGGSPFVVFINPDTRLLDYDYSNIINHLAQNPRAGLAGPKMVNFDGSTQGSARGFYGVSTLLAGRRGPLTILFPNSKIVNRDLPNYAYNNDNPMQVDWISGACMFVKREVLERIGGFDQSFFMYFEDTDLCHRLARHGYQVYYFPKAKIAHQVGQSSSKVPFKSLWWFHKSWHRYMCKHYLPQNPIIKALSGLFVCHCFLIRSSFKLFMNLLKR